jgi:DNA-binding MarR family transcriptional regulator
MRSDKLGRVSVDLLSVTPLVNRLIRRKLLMTTLADAEIDLKLLHFEIMHVLRDEGTMHPAKIGEKLIIAKAQMTHLIDKLVELDFVKRELDSVDRRTFNITLTEKGKQALSEQDNLVFCAISDIMASLPETELESLSNALRSIRDTLFKLQ